MTTILSTMILLTSIFLILLVIGLVEKIEWLTMACSLCLFFQGVLIYGLVGILAYCYTVKNPVKVEIVKNSEMVFVHIHADGTPTVFEYTSHKEYMEISDSTCTFTLIRHFNMYGQDIYRNVLEYTLKKNASTRNK